MKTNGINITTSTTSIDNNFLNNWKKSYYKCPHCGSHNTEVDTSCVLTIKVKIK